MLGRGKEVPCLSPSGNTAGGALPVHHLHLRCSSGTPAQNPAQCWCALPCSLPVLQFLSCLLLLHWLHAPKVCSRPANTPTPMFSLHATYLHLYSCTRSLRHRSSFSSLSRSPSTHSSCFLRLQMKFSKTGSRFLLEAGRTYCCSSSHLVVSTLFCCSSSRTWGRKRCKSHPRLSSWAKALQVPPLPGGKNKNKIRNAEG